MNKNPALLAIPLVLLAAFPAPAAPTAVPFFGWMSGHWCSQAGDESVEEYWMPPGGDLALGLSRTVKDGKTTSFEFLRIRNDGSAIYYVAQPQGSPPTAFRLTASGADWARFENPEHDFPTRVEYRRTATGLAAEISGPDGKGGQSVIPFDYRPCAG